MPTDFSASGSGFVRVRVEIREHRLEAALHVEAVVAVADRLVERSELVRMVDDRPRHGLDQLARQCLVHAISVPACILRYPVHA